MTPRCTYILPLRHAAADEAAELGAYLDTLVPHAEVIVVDGSDEHVFTAHRAAFPEEVSHIPVDPDLTFAFGKVNGVLTGMRRAGCEAVVIADDDVRYSPDLLERLVALLDRADVVRPQNVFLAPPWHARWDTARSLLARVAGSDWPGTLAVRRSVLARAGGYDGDCLFENLELVRTVEASGGRALSAPWLFVPRRPPDASHFWSQRVRQAYDSFAQPWRLVLELAVAPAMAMAGRRVGPTRALTAAAVASVTAAEIGRRRHGGTQVFPPTAALWAPAWVTERAVAVWLAVGSRSLLGGVPYGGRRLRTAAHSRRHLARVLPAGGGGSRMATAGSSSTGPTAPSRRSSPTATTLAASRVEVGTTTAPPELYGQIVDRATIWRSSCPPSPLTPSPSPA